jgi:hypothetical protein
LRLRVPCSTPYFQSQKYELLDTFAYLDAPYGYLNSLKPPGIAKSQNHSTSALGSQCHPNGQLFIGHIGRLSLFMKPFSVYGFDIHQTGKTITPIQLIQLCMIFLLDCYGLLFGCILSCWLSRCTRWHSQSLPCKTTCFSSVHGFVLNQATPKSIGESSMIPITLW